MRIGVAGAGAGKTTTMADIIVKLRKETDESKVIFCITFTNNAVICIEKKLAEHYGMIPNNIIVSTIHSFLYREFIKPYYYVLYGKQYERISIAELPQNPGYKKAKIKRLEDRDILHQTVIPERAKWVMVKKSDDRKPVKDKRMVIKDNFKEYCGAICIDEAQDIDSDMQMIIEAIHKTGIPLILMGDPKQDLKGHKCLRELVGKHKDDVEYLTICHRCPEKHLKISNVLVSSQEQQYSNKNGGVISIQFEKKKSCSELIKEKNFDLSYISQKQGKYETHSQEKVQDVKTALSEEIESVMRVKHPNANEVVLLRSSYYYAERLLEAYAATNDKKKAMRETFKCEQLDTKAYGIIINMIPDDTDAEAEKMIFVSSIDRVKGQEGENCLFILTTDLAAYLFGDKTEDTTTKNRLYVALTRSLNKLTIFVTKQVEDKYGRDFIISFFHEICNEN